MRPLLGERLSCDNSDTATVSGGSELTEISIIS